jgi:hypothetical protein
MDRGRGNSRILKQVEQKSGEDKGGSRPSKYPTYTKSDLIQSLYEEIRGIFHHMEPCNQKTDED